MNSLYELINSSLDTSYILHKSRVLKLDELINNCDLCYQLIERCLDVRTTFRPRFEKQRARHIIITFLLGRCLGTFDGLFEDINQLNVINNEYLWLYTSMAHDYGYFSEEIKCAYELTYFENEYKLLSDHIKSNKFIILKDFSLKYPSYFTYSYEQIRNYYEYARDYHNNINDKKEKIDHGIVGACLVFNQVCDFWDRGGFEHSVRNGIRKVGNMVIDEQYDLLLYKAACITVASHNIYKSSNPNYDDLYKKHNLDFLCSNSDFRVGRRNALLLLMCLVDTVECTKCFDKNGFVLNPKSILQSISVDVTRNNIVFDFSQLLNLRHRNWDEKEFAKLVEKHVNGVESLNDWTYFKTRRINKFVVEIYI